MKRVIATNPATGWRSEGHPIPDEWADAAVARMNREYPELRHWAESVAEEDKPGEDTEAKEQQ